MRRRRCPRPGKASIDTTLAPARAPTRRAVDRLVEVRLCPPRLALSNPTLLILSSLILSFGQPCAPLASALLQRRSEKSTRVQELARAPKIAAKKAPLIANSKHAALTPACRARRVAPHDAPHHKTSVVNQISSNNRTRVGGGRTLTKMCARRHACDAVSYTHLTLPTIE